MSATTTVGDIPANPLAVTGSRPDAASGVGKAILAGMPIEQVRKIIDKSGMPGATDKTISDFDSLAKELKLIRRRGYAIDDGEQEVGVHCYAVPVTGLPIPMALSVSGPVFRVTKSLGALAVPALKARADALARELLGTIAEQD